MPVLENTETRLFHFHDLVASREREYVEARHVDRLNALLDRIDVASMLREGTLLWETICQIHEAFLNSVTCGECEPNLAIEQRIWKLYMHWLENSQKLRSMLSDFSDHGIEIEHAVEFLRCLDDAAEQLDGFKMPEIAIRSFVGR